MITILVAAWFLLTVHVEAVPLSFQGQLNVALQKIAELKGDAFDNCCNVKSYTVGWLYIHNIHYSRNTSIVMGAQNAWLNAP